MFLGAGNLISPAAAMKQLQARRDVVKVSVSRRRRSACGGSRGAVAAASQGSGFAMETSSAVVLFSAPCKVMARSGLVCWACVVPLAPSRSLPLLSAGICFSAARVFSWDVSNPSPEPVLTGGRKTQYQRLPPLLQPPPSPWLRAQGIARRASSLLVVICRSPGGSRGPYGQSRAQGAKLGSRVPRGEEPAKSQLCDLPAWSPFVTAWERKEVIRKVLFALQR